MEQKFVCRFTTWILLLFGVIRLESSSRIELSLSITQHFLSPSMARLMRSAFLRSAAKVCYNDGTCALEQLHRNYTRRSLEALSLSFLSLKLLKRRVRKIKSWDVEFHRYHSEIHFVKQTSIVYINSSEIYTFSWQIENIM